MFCRMRILSLRCVLGLSKCRCLAACCTAHRYSYGGSKSYLAGSSKFPSRPANQYAGSRNSSRGSSPASSRGASPSYTRPWAQSECGDRCATGYNSLVQHQPRQCTHIGSHFAIQPEGLSVPGLSAGFQSKGKALCAKLALLLALSAASRCVHVQILPPRGRHVPAAHPPSSASTPQSTSARSASGSSSGCHSGTAAAPAGAAAHPHPCAAEEGISRVHRPPAAHFLTRLRLTGGVRGV